MQAVIDVKALQYTSPTALTRATKLFNFRVADNSSRVECYCIMPAGNSSQFRAANFGSKHSISFGLHCSEGVIWQMPSRLKV
jgi:hypothetical protein